MRNHGTGSHDRPRADPYAGHDDRARADRCTPLDSAAFQVPVRLRLQLTRSIGCPRKAIVDENRPVTDEYLIFDHDAVADESVALDLATPSDRCAPLDLYERPYLSFVSDSTAVQIRERVDDHVFPEPDFRDESEGSIVHRTGRSVCAHRSRLLPVSL
jgi:hypothetical protein